MKEIDRILHETNEVANQETAHLSSKYREAAVHGRATRHISLAEKSAAEDYYKKAGRNFDNDENAEPYQRIIALIFVYALIACLVNLILYLPVYYLTKSWGNVSKHDAVYITIIINTAVSAILIGISSEITMKRKAFIAGMRAEADNHIISNYHVAKDKLDERYTSNGNLPDYDFDWKE
ncbi:MAG TPA: hypothetical protein VHB51_02535 [Candidatus Saccharimonadales bacterium]|nr:hypothetical protein [Candidatus Saccharimonadales bacterium]